MFSHTVLMSTQLYSLAFFYNRLLKKLFHLSSRYLLNEIFKIYKEASAYVNVKTQLQLLNEKCYQNAK